MKTLTLLVILLGLCSFSSSSFADTKKCQQVEKDSLDGSYNYKTYTSGCQKVIAIKKGDNFSNIFLTYLKDHYSDLCVVKNNGRYEGSLDKAYLFINGEKTSIFEVEQMLSSKNIKVKENAAIYIAVFYFISENLTKAKFSFFAKEC